MKNPLMSSVLLGTAVVTMAAATPATAENGMTIPYHDLDLATEEGRDTLDRRIEEAARNVCGFDDVRTGTRMRSKEVTTCYRKAKAQAKKQFAAVIEAQQRGG